VLGSTQPGKIGEYVRRVVSGIGDDGLLQRFSMAVWPDMSPDWEEHDRYPDSQYKHTAFEAFRHLDRVDAASVNAEADPDGRDDGSGFLRFDPEAQEIFRDWRRGFEPRVRNGELHPALESHLAKYRKLVPSLALIHHLANRGTGPVNGDAVLAALSWADYLEAHAHRIYQSGTAGELDGTKLILRALKQGRLEGTFTARDVLRRNWSPLREDAAKVRGALDLLVEYQWLRCETMAPGASGGRPSAAYRVNPKGFAR
jgi:putative DNA primase/helicase